MAVKSRLDVKLLHVNATGKSRALSTRDALRQLCGDAHDAADDAENMEFVVLFKVKPRSEEREQAIDIF
jgi:hypothetical protein